MKDEQDYIRDISEIRSMMERSSKFLSLSGLSGILMGIYALLGAFVAWKYFHFNPSDTATGSSAQCSEFKKVLLLGSGILFISICTALYFTSRNANKNGEKVWNASSRMLLTQMSVPLVAGGLLILVIISHGLFQFAAPLSLLFYGIALFNAGRFSYVELRSLGLINIGLGLVSGYYVESALLLWALGFGVLHIVYGIYMHYRYER